MYRIAKQEGVEDVRLDLNTGSAIPLLGKGGQKNFTDARCRDTDKANLILKKRGWIHSFKHVGEAYPLECAG